jgi:hypothetical protein
MPIVFSGFVPRIEKENNTLKVYLKIVECSKKNDELCCANGHTESYIVVSRKLAGFSNI